jgi:hypothetical protein
MQSEHASFQISDQRRAGIRRTAWVAAWVALGIFVLFFVQQGLWH